MKFLYKILLCTIIIMAAAFGFNGYFFVNFVFESALEREIQQALDGSNILRFAFETAVLNIPTKYNVLQDTAVEQIGSRLESSGQGSARYLRLSNESRETLYVSNDFPEDTSLLLQVGQDTRAWEIIAQGERYYVHTAAMVNALDRMLYLETLDDVTEVFEERSVGFSVYRRVTLAMLACSAAVMLLICIWLTKPIRLLGKATRRMAEGDYGYRAKQVSNDELGRLTTDFNSMANVLEGTISELQEEVRAREDFIAAFAHELKTPLTAIIGYADMLRTRKLDDEKHFLSANYIYTEGKRLENMSFRLLDIIVTKREVIEPQPIEAKMLFDYFREIYSENTDQKIRISVQPGIIYGEVNLLKSVLLNLMDNACKASSAGGVVRLSGRQLEDGYAFEVKDYGVGIPEEELKKVTEAFYMVDKSRSRSKNGAGLGLALCVEILRLHNSELHIESKAGEGTCIGFVIPGQFREAGGEAEPEEDVDKAGGEAEPEEDVDKAGGEAEPEEDVDKAGGEAEPEEDVDKAGGEAEPEGDVKEPGGESIKEADVEKAGSEGIQESGSEGRSLQDK